MARAIDSNKVYAAKYASAVVENHPTYLAGNFHSFVRAAWPQVEPGNYVDGWHIQAIAEHLEAVTRGEIQQLIINCPPRHMKSLLVSVFWPAWEWASNAKEQYLVATYAQGLTVRDSLRMRRLVTSDWYQGNWPHVQLRQDQWAKTFFENTSGGNRKSVSVGSQVTGFGGSRKIIDDPHNALDVDGSKRQDVLDWFKYAFATRDNDPAKTVTVLIMQRLREADLTGHLLEQGGWEQLILPAEYEGNQTFTSIGWTDPRKEIGELLWPKRFDQKALAKLKLNLGTMGSAGQLQQRPTAKEGGEFLREWFEERNRYDPADHYLINKTVARWLSFDTAMKDKDTNDYSAMTVWELLDDYRLIMRQAWRQRVRFPTLVSKIETAATEWNRDGKLYGVLIEDKGSGTSAIQTLEARLPPELFDLVIAINPQGSKEVRVRMAAIWADRNCILLPMAGNGTFELEEEMFKFPNAKHDDMLDTMTQAIIYLQPYLSLGYQLRAGYVTADNEEQETELIGHLA